MQVKSDLPPFKLLVLTTHLSDCGAVWNNGRNITLQEIFRKCIEGYLAHTEIGRCHQIG